MTEGLPHRPGDSGCVVMVRTVFVLMATAWLVMDARAGGVRLGAGKPV